MAPLLADARCCCQLPRITATQLQRQRMFGGIMVEKPGGVAMAERRTGDHLGVEQQPWREQPQKEAGMAVGATHHRRDAEATIEPHGQNSSGQGQFPG